jgi:hypothetical protein
VSASTLRRLLLALAVMVLSLGYLTPVQAVGPTACTYDTILNGQYTLIPLKNQAMLSHERCGYRFRAGQQDSHLVITPVSGGLLFHDSGSREWKSIPGDCKRVSVTRGVAATCPVTGATSESDPMLIEVWPRLGDDYIDASALPAQFQVAALVDAGVDTVYGGAGDDFVNGAMQRDRVWGGGGSDWIRTGDGNDEIWGDAGVDKLVGSGGSDAVHGGEGDDRVDGGAGDDSLWADGGRDVVACGGAWDRAVVDTGDRHSHCESVSSS